MTTPMPSQARSASEVVRVWLLGGFRVSVGSRTVGGDRWRRKKAAALVKLLALSPGHRMHRERVMDLLWPHLGGEAATNNLHRTLYEARRILEPGPVTGPRCLSLQGEQLSLCPESELWVDVEAFEQAAAAARRSRDPAAYRAALDLYAGELLPEDRYEGWAEGHRGRLRERRLSLLLGLARLHEERADHDGAAEALGEVLAVDPVREEAHVGLMRLHALSGHRGEALRRYERLEEVLSRELGARPAAASRVLREEIAAGRFPPPPERQPPGVVSESASEPEGRSEGGGEGPKHNLPAQRTSFVGREREMLELKRQLAMTRLLTLTGMGGSGKTRLALEVAGDLVGTYPDGAWLAELAPLSEGARVPQAVAKAVKVPEQPGRPLTEALVDHLREKRLLLVLDSCEHLIDEAARLADALVSACPLLRVVATSREVLGVEGELVWRVDPLSYPDADPDAHRSPAAGELERHDAVRLLVERARRYSPRFELSAENAGAVARICRGLAGMPLAIELVAARMAILAAEQIAERLDRALGLLTSGSLAADPRHESLRATMDWSYELLGESEQRLLGRLSVFAGGFSLEAAEAVGAGDGIEPSDVLKSLLVLVDKSLVVAGPAGDGGGRYGMLEPVRQYARERLEEGGETERVLRRHAAFFLALAEEAAPELTGAHQQEWAQRLEAEHDNMRAALSWSLEKEPETALRLTGALARFWEMRCRFVEGSGWLDAALRRSDRADAATRAKLLSEAGTFAFHRADFYRAIALHGEALTLYRELGDDGGAAFALLCLGAQYLKKGDHGRAAPFLEEALALSRRTGDKRNTALTLHNLAEVERQRGNYERAKALGTQSIALSREIEDTWLLAIGVGWVGMSAVWSGDEPDLAERFLKEGLALNLDIGNWAYVAYCLEGFAGLAGARGQGARAARLWGAAEALRKTIGAPLPPEPRPYYERSMSAARARLGEAAWEAAFAEGMAMTAEEAAEYALSEEVAATPEGLPVGGGPQGPLPNQLTPREREVAALVAQGLSNRQIARELHLSERTVGNHVSKILRKLGFSSRAQVAAWATEQRLPVKSTTD